VKVPLVDSVTVALPSAGSVPPQPSPGEPPLPAHCAVGSLEVQVRVKGVPTLKLPLLEEACNRMLGPMPEPDDPEEPLLLDAPELPLLPPPPLAEQPARAKLAVNSNAAAPRAYIPDSILLSIALLP
jgi:hypothetical protein